MKRIFCIISLAAALASCQVPNQQTAVVASASDSSAVSFSIAYVNTDSLLGKYEYAKKCEDELNSKAENARADLNQKARVFQQEAAEFQRKIQYNAFTSADRAQAEGERLQRKEQELQELNQKLSADLMQEQARLSAELRDTLQNFLAQYAAGRYSLILSNTMGDNVLFAAPGVDITNEVVAALNARYVAKK